MDWQFSLLGEEGLVRFARAKPLWPLAVLITTAVAAGALGWLLKLSTTDTLLLTLIAVIIVATHNMASLFHTSTGELREDIRWNNLLPYFLDKDEIAECKDMRYDDVVAHVRSSAEARKEVMKSTLLLSTELRALYDEVKEELLKEGQKKIRAAGGET